MESGAQENAESALPAGSARPKCDRADALAVLRRLRVAGHAAYFAGGCVRDLLLGREPKDWDVATDAPPKRVRELFSNTQAVGAAFGVILVRHRRSVVEVATFRADVNYVDGRHPSAVRFTTAEEDAKRRDFTINGLFLDPLREGALEDQVIDYVGGQADLKGKMVRAIGEPEARFNEDHLRMLRAVRFAARLGYAVEPATATAIVNHAPQLVRISPERIAEELRLMLTPPTRVEAYRMLNAFELLPLVFRFLEVREPRAVGVGESVHAPDYQTLPSPLPSPVVPGEGEKRPVIVSVFEQVAPNRKIPFGLAMGAASLDHLLWRHPSPANVRPLFEKAMVQRITRAMRQSLRISNDEADAMQGSLEAIAPLLRDEFPSVATMKRFLARPTAELSRELLLAMRATGHLPDRIAALQERLAELEKADVTPAPLLTGDDLSAAGLAPGPLFKKLLDTAYDAQLEDRVTSREQALALALQMAKEAS